MTAMTNAWITDNHLRAAATPLLSVLVPFLNDDPRPLLHALAREAEALNGAVELIVLDDGSTDAELSEQVAAAIEASTLPARSIRLIRNEGRSKGRNRLAANARGRHLLFIDADMLPDAEDFLQRYMRLIAQDDTPVAFGGFSVKQCPPDPRHELHRRMCVRSDCAGAEVRRRDPEKFVFTSNLLVRRDVFEAEAFDEGFAGWGWEDVEWGIRVSQRWPVTHIDNPATHLGLDAPETIAAKYEQSAANFARVSHAHPEVVSHYPSHRAALILGRLPFRSASRRLFRKLALMEGAPLGLRAFSMRLYRAALCAEVL